MNDSESSNIDQSNNTGDLESGSREGLCRDSENTLDTFNNNQSAKEVFKKAVRRVSTIITLPRETKRQDILGQMSVPVEKMHKFRYFGIKFYTMGCLFELLLLAFLFGYMDVFTIIKYDIFTTTMTGNVITMAQASVDNKPNLVGLTIAVIFCHTFFGAMLSSRLLTMTHDRNKTLFILLVLQGAMLMVDLVATNLRGTPPSEYVIILALFQGALFHWSSKTGFSTALQTINLQRIAEATYRYVFRYSQGGPKLRGDMLYTFMIIIAFIIGSFFCAVMNKHVPKFALLPPLVVTCMTAFNFGDYTVGTDLYGYVFPIVLVDEDEEKKKPIDSVQPKTASTPEDNGIELEATKNPVILPEILDAEARRTSSIGGPIADRVTTVSTSRIFGGLAVESSNAQVQDGSMNMEKKEMLDEDEDDFNFMRASISVYETVTNIGPHGHLTRPSKENYDNPLGPESKNDL